MAKTRIGSNASFTGGGFGLSIVGDHCYAYSGAVTSAPVSGPDTKMLDFYSGKGYIKSKLQFITKHRTTQVVYLDIQFNGVSIWDGEKDHTPDKDWGVPIHLVIPPLTRVQVFWGLTNDTADGFVTLTGRVYA